MRYSPGKWSERLIDGEMERAARVEHHLGDYGEETAAEVMATAQEWVSRFTVVIGTTGMAKDTKDMRDMAPGSGVLVQLNGGTYGVLTAGHVLRRGDNTKNGASATILVPPRSRKQGGNVMGIDVLYRSCTVDGFDNESEDGPDIAIIPLEKEEWGILDGWGMVAYNLDKDRWSDEEKTELRKMNPWVLSIINGIRFGASQIVYGHTDGNRGSLAIVATNTRVEIIADRGDYDYLELPSETTKCSYPTHWKNELPGTAAKEIEGLHDEGVTKRVWEGTSGAGVWNLVIGTTEKGLPNGRVLAELAGICFYANPDTGCIIAHGTKSITNIAARHVEKETLRYLSKA